TSGVVYTPGTTTWSYTGKLSIGTNRFAVTATGSTGLTSLPATIAIAYADGVPPPSPVITTDGGSGPGADYATTSSSLFLNGTCSSATKTIKVNGSTSGVTYASGATTWSYRSTLNEGANEYSVTATDAVDLESPPATITITLNTGSAVPTPEITTDGGNGPGADFTTTVSSLALTGTCDSSVATILVNGSSSGVHYVPGETIWSYGTDLNERPPITATAFQNEGTEQADILASVQDVDGLWSPADIVPTGTVTVDYYATGRDPYYFDAISLEFPGTDLDLSNLVLKVYLQKGSASDASWEHYQLLPGQFNPTNENTYDFVYLPDDPRDYLPNDTIPAETTVGWVEIPFDATADPSFIESDGDIALTLRLWNWRVEAVRLGQVAEGTVPLDEGPNTFSVLARDGSGISSGADTIVITLDTTAPAPPVITTDGGAGPGSDFVAYTNHVVLAGTCDSSTWRILVNGSDSSVTYTPGNTTWQCDGWLLDGSNTFAVTAEDRMGNCSAPVTINVSLNHMTIVEGAPMNAAGACCALLIVVLAGLRRNRTERTRTRTEDP
ncbi:MAG: hypothetical protein J7M12_04695, partial [Candidatus Hydrogenedentes bacterium]|nr:hypothetical protein [Candidatus Hydrogenedentota bacterium]